MKQEEIFRTLATRNNTTRDAVERAIRYALIKNIKKAQKVLNLNCKLTNSRFITALQRKVLMGG